ncbi:MAG: DNA-directed RNA polymerase subunit alpha [Candidatus Omnitrophica bacterium CG1_02_49_10]|nr:MAG: DNA-directed RNA polymerase subunit alpha [Candidatus Omnitrophica bacterium CG1_02_49_10]
MGINWKSFETPKRLECDEATLTATYGKFVAEPFERGYGATIGNSLRRMLLSSIDGSAVVSVKVDGVKHEFDTIEGVVEDMAQIILNLKMLVIRSHSKELKKVFIKADKAGDITARDIITDETVEVLNPEMRIATLSKKMKFYMELEVGRGRGYVPAERNKREGLPVGAIPIDSIFTPVKKVNYSVENTRVGQITDYDKLILETWTNGSVSPKDALLYASNILYKHLDIFVHFGKLPEEEEEVDTSEIEALYEKLRQPVTEMELSVRSANCLREAKIKTIGALVENSEVDMLKYRNFGKKSLSEIAEILKEMGLSFGMKIDKAMLGAKKNDEA